MQSAFSRWSWFQWLHIKKWADAQNTEDQWQKVTHFS
jgi:hypothetical protein